MRNTNKKSVSELKSLHMSFDPSRIHVAEVMDTRNITNNGAIKVWLINSAFDKKEKDKWLTAYYASPFAGSTPNQTISDDFVNTKKSYGMWFTPPDVGNKVLICFANGRSNTTDVYYFACLHDHFMDHMIPGIARDMDTDNNNPRTEYNKANPSSDNTKRTDYIPLTDGLIKQGLINDTLRGPCSSSARREAPSRVYGIVTPRGTQIVLDDGYDDNDIQNWEQNPDTSNLTKAETNPANTLSPRKEEGFRIRTRSGTQILISEEYGNVYVINKDGNTWFELNNDGFFDLYSQNDISLRSGRNINIRADNNVNIEAQNDVNIRAVDGSIKNECKQDMNMSVGNDQIVKIGRDSSLNVKRNETTEIIGNSHKKVDSTYKINLGTYEIKTIGDMITDVGNDCYDNYGKDLYQGWLNGGIRPYSAKYSYTATEPYTHFYPATVSETIQRCGTKDLEDFIATLTPVNNPIDPATITKIAKSDKSNADEGNWVDITTITSNTRLPQHEPWSEHTISTTGFRHHVLEGSGSIDGQSTKINSVQLKAEKPLTVIGTPRTGMAVGVYEGKEYKANIPIYEYKVAPIGLLNPCANYVTGKNGLEFIKEKEGFSSKIYLDITGKPHIGYGHLIKPNEKFTTITKDEATIILMADLKGAESSVKKFVTVNITQNQFDALVSFVFNLNETNFKNSTLLKLLNLGKYELIPNEFIKWKYASIGGIKQPVTGLLNRRIEEANMFSTHEEIVV